MRKCEVCGNDDLPVDVACSGLGAISFAYCFVCLAMSAEPGQGSDGIEFITYRDGSYWSGETLIPIKTNGGESYNTRAAYLARAKPKIG